ncbi:MAG: DNA helicase-2/ATP-dependent DNA helicase PcrA [Desulforhopalus sp.]|jgi:DNA helicase-2/ATP-dependent DNA helicase PcrA
MNLTEEQLRIVEHSGGHARVSAVAGSGKTTTMVARIGHLLESDIAAENILILMFNRSARDAFEEAMEKNLSYLNKPLPEVRTFHSFGLRLVNSFAKKGVLPQHRLVTEAYIQERLARKVANDAYRDANDEDGYLTGDDIEEFLTFVDQVKSTVRGAKKVFGEQDLSSRLHFFPEAYVRFEEARKKEKIRFYSDLIHEPLMAMLDSDELASWVANRVDHIIVDEYQDINECQQQLIKTVAGKRARVMVVGDVDQCIYEWRGARPEYITTRFAKDFVSPTNFQLSYTFRYGHQLSLAANHLIANNRKRDKKLCVSHESTGDTVLSCVEEQSGKGVQLEIGKWLADGRSLSDAVVLVRLFAQTVPVELALLEAGIAYRLEGGADVFDCSEILALMGYLNLGFGSFQDNPPEIQKKQLEAMFSQPHLGVRRDELQALATTILGDLDRAREILSDWCTSDVPPFIKKRFREAAETWSWLYTNGRSGMAGPFLKKLVERLKLYEFYHSFSARAATAENRVKTCEAFINFAINHNLTISGLIEKIAELQGEKNGEHGDTLLITSIHRAKGLEWPLVILPGLEDGSFPFYKDREKEGSLEDERRLFYVAITRGIEKVTCIHPVDAQLKRNITGNFSKVPPGMLRASRFLYEANIGLSAALGMSLAQKGNGKGLSADEILIAEEYLQTLGVATGLTQKKSAIEPGKKAGPNLGTQQPKYLGISDISEGLMVFHSRFGAGTVTAIKDKKQGRLTVLFDDHGEMVLLAAYAKLEHLGV